MEECVRARGVADPVGTVERCLACEAALQKWLRQKFRAQSDVGLKYA